MNSSERMGLGVGCRRLIVAACAGLAVLGGRVPDAHAALDPTHFSGWSAIPNGTFRSAPGISSWAPGTLIVVGRGMDNQVYSDTWSNGAWQSSWTAQGGVVASSPAIATWGPDGYVMVALGTNDYVYVKVVEPYGGGVHGWTRIPGATFRSDVAIAYGSSRLYVAARATDNNIYLAINNVTGGYDGAAWSAWSLVPGGAMRSAPALSAAGGYLRVVARDGSKRVNVEQGDIVANPDAPFGGASWSLSGVGVYISAIAVSGWASSHVDVFGVGNDNYVWAESAEAGVWSSQAIQLSGPTSAGMASHPAAYSWGVGHIDIVARGTDNKFYINTYQD